MSGDEALREIREEKVGTKARETTYEVNKRVNGRDETKSAGFRLTRSHSRIYSCRYNSSNMQSYAKMSEHTNQRIRFDVRHQIPPLSTDPGILPDARIEDLLAKFIIDNHFPRCLHRAISKPKADSSSLT